MRIRNVIISIAAIAVIGSTMPFGLRVAHAGGSCYKETMSDAATTIVSLEANCFEPTVIRIAPGDSITWINVEEQRHMVTGANGGWGSGEELLLNDQVTLRFDDTGVFPYFCWLHPGMVGAVVVGDGTASDAVTNASITSLGVTRGQGAAAPADGTAALPAPPSGDDISRSTFALGAGAIALVVARLLSRRTIRSQCVTNSISSTRRRAWRGTSAPAATSSGRPTADTSRRRAKRCPACQSSPR